jgi:hypothetical protein
MLATSDYGRAGSQRSQSDGACLRAVAGRRALDTASLRPKLHPIGNKIPALHR